jgi:predicted NAD-dependent protein-ADP-ribosyltransferase YbiA (DUF1768 family)
MSDAIRRFRGEHFFLSNMYPVPNSRMRTIDGFPVDSSERAYMAARFKLFCDRVAVASVRGAVEDTKPYKDGLAAKTLTHEMIAKGRPHYGEPEERIALMRQALALKFDPISHPDLASRLVGTGDIVLIEGNTWDDTFWGVDSETGEGANHLGKLLMERRKELAL